MKSYLNRELIKIRAWVLIIIVAVAFLLRFYNIDEKGLFTYDDARALLFAKTIYSMFHGEVLANAPEFFSSAKPGAIWPFVGLSLLLVPDDHLFAIYTASWGVAAVLLTMALANKMLGYRGALLAGLISALSPLQVHYSRNLNLAGSMSLFFTLLAFYALIRNIEKRTFTSALFFGGVLGYAVTVNYSLLPYLAFVAILDLIAGVVDNKVRIQNLTGSFLGAISFPLIFEGWYRILSSIDTRFFSYFQMLGMHRQAISQDKQIYFDPLFFIRLFANYEGGFFFVSVVGICYVAYGLYRKGRNRSLSLSKDASLLALCAITGLLLIMLSAGTAYLVTVPRTAYSVLPFLPFLAVIPLLRLSDVIGNFSQKKATLGILKYVGMLPVSLLFLWNMPKVQEVVELQSGYKQAASWLNARKNEKAVCYVHCILYWNYSDKFISGLDLPGNLTDAKYVFVDEVDRSLLGKADFMGWDKYESKRQYIAYLDNNTFPKMVFENRVWGSELMLLEQGVGSEMAANLKDDLFGGQIRAYGLTQQHPMP